MEFLIPHAENVKATKFTCPWSMSDKKTYLCHLFLTLAGLFKKNFDNHWPLLIRTDFGNWYART